MAGLAIFSSLISLYYYLQVIRQMYAQPAPASARSSEEVGHSDESEHVSGARAGHEDAPGAEVTELPSPSPLILTVLALGLVAVVWLGVYPAPLLDLVELASRAILSSG